MTELRKTDAFTGETLTGESLERFQCDASAQSGLITLEAFFRKVAELDGELIISNSYSRSISRKYESVTDGDAKGAELIAALKKNGAEIDFDNKPFSAIASLIWGIKEMEDKDV